MLSSHQLVGRDGRGCAGMGRGPHYVPADVEIQVSRDSIEERHGRTNEDWSGSRE